MKITNVQHQYLQSEQYNQSGTVKPSSVKEEVSHPECDVYISEEAFEKYREEIQERMKALEEKEQAYPKQTDILAVGKWYDKLIEKEKEIKANMRKNNSNYGFTDIMSMSAYAYATLYQEIEEKFSNPNPKEVKSFGWNRIKTKEEEIEELNLAYDKVMQWNMMAMDSCKIRAEIKARFGNEPLEFAETDKSKEADRDELKSMMQEIKEKVSKQRYDNKENMYSQVNAIVTSTLRQNQAFWSKMQWLFKDFSKDGIGK